MDRGTLIDQRYQLSERLQDRGLGENWTAHDTHMKGRAVAVKLLRELTTPEMPDALAKHLQALRPIRHRSLLAVINHGVWLRRPYLVHEQFSGRSLGTGLDEVRASGQLVELPVLQRSFEQVCDAVLACHEAPTPVLHLGLNPGCALMHRQPRKDFEAKVLDVGLLPWADRDPTAPLRSARALENPAPELFGATAAPSVRTDVFALGALLREILSLPPEMGETLAIAGIHRRREDVPEEVWSIVEQCVELDPDRRFADVTALRSALREAWKKAPRRRPAPAPVSTPRAAVMPGDAPAAPDVFERLRALEAEAPPPAPRMTLLRASDPNPWDVAETPGDPFEDAPTAKPATSSKAARLEALFGAASERPNTTDDGGATLISAPPSMGGGDDPGNATLLASSPSTFARGAAPSSGAAMGGTMLWSKPAAPADGAAVMATAGAPAPATPTDGTAVMAALNALSADAPARPGSPFEGTLLMRPGQTAPRLVRQEMPTAPPTEEPAAIARPGHARAIAAAVAVLALLVAVFALVYRAAR